ncbi:MAG: hypothetical protein CMM55_17405 [Rhodospirillaceae bacterium]|nr:hypothetical protein [Rhodospirillaceae bacterium]
MTVPWGGATATEEAWCLEALRSVGNVDLADPLADLTVVVPSRRRQSYLLRQIRYWSHRSVRLVIVDGSEQPLGRSVLDALKSHPRISYVHDPRSMSVRLQRAGQMIGTPFAVMLGDDEFQVPTGLRESIAVLRGNADLVGCMGQVVAFLPVGGFRRLTFHRGYRQMEGFEVCQADPADRLLAAFEEYTMATCYAVLTTSAWRSSWGAVLDYTSGHAAEIQQAMAVHLSGGFATTNHLQMLRSVENPTDPVADAEADGKIWFPEWWEGPEFSGERDRFVTVLVETSVGLDRDSPDRARCSRWITDAAAFFVDRNRAGIEQASIPMEGPGFGRRRFEKARNIVGQLPVGLDLFLRRVRRRILQAVGRGSADDYGSVQDLKRRAMADSITVSDELIRDLKEIEEVVTGFHALRRRN